MPAARLLPAAALFDWDGTLVDTIPMIYRANVVALREFGITLTREWYRERYTPDWRRSYRELGIPEHQWDAVATRWGEEMASGRPRALPWARPALRRLRTRGVRLGLVTASTRAVVEHNLGRLNLDGVFEAIRYSDDVARSKPHPDALLEALDELGVAAADTVYVGDTTVDLEMARAAGAPFVAVGRTTRPEAFRAHGVEVVWPGVGAWADDLLGTGRRRNGSDRHGSAGRPRP
ncbi:MAG TPA: HAD family hydrolase [Candidatus Limnocylindrales bacterium]|nr:HAD family hydrolase [Candidatus Limnocylindrales bacterium]